MNPFGIVKPPTVRHPRSALLDHSQNVNSCEYLLKHFYLLRKRVVRSTNTSSVRPRRPRAVVFACSSDKSADTPQRVLYNRGQSDAHRSFLVSFVSPRYGLDNKHLPEFKRSYRNKRKIQETGSYNQPRCPTPGVPHPSMISYPPSCPQIPHPPHPISVGDSRTLKWDLFESALEEEIKPVDFPNSIEP
ncbi:hypothetical protein EVAR_99259_1 [Eumeta japonica]|uniref:Uncharacterized protein n=1 Tax=Eumeta variegata TaxID=151549 RepID=A0A4C1TGE2_EUMVA|nr:hypothetical protein EVAR_99259_1 [Eumeta japonica]